MNDWWLISLLALLIIGAVAWLSYPLKTSKVTWLLVTPIILLLVISAYLLWGGFAQWQAHQYSLATKEQAKQMLRSIKTPDELIAKLKAKLNETPQSAKGWYLLGRLYSNQNDFAQATEAFATAHKLLPNNEQYTVNYIHGLWTMNNQQFNEPIIIQLKNLLRSNPNQPDALAMLAMHAFMSHDYEGAINYWQRLLKLASPQSEEALAIHKAIAKAQEQLNSLREEKND